MTTKKHDLIYKYNMKLLETDSLIQQLKDGDPLKLAMMTQRNIIISIIQDLWSINN